MPDGWHQKCSAQAADAFHPWMPERLRTFIHLPWSCLKYVYPTVTLTLTQPRISLFPPAQILTGTTPFPNESNEEIVDKVTEGLRPDRPFDSPSHGISDELWKQIVVCWDQEPNERPTAPQVLRALGEAKHREPVIPVEGSDGGMVMKEWNWTESDHEECTYSGWL